MEVVVKLYLLGSNDIVEQVLINYG